MSERFNPRQVLQDPDVQTLGAFGGLSSASYQTTGDILYCNRLTNAYVTNRNEIKRRQGSRVLTWLNGTTADNLPGFRIYRFTFDGTDYIVTKSGNSLFLDYYDKANVYKKTATKAGVFPGVAATEEATITTVIEGNTCYILVAVNSLPLVVGVLFKRTLSGLTIGTSTTFSASIANYPSTNVINNNNTFVFNDDTDVFIRTSAITQAGSSLSFTSVDPHGLTVSNSVKVHSFFCCQGKPANYYPGSYLFNIAARKNAVALDVNVQLPNEIVDNPIVNESKIQDLSINSVILYKTNSATATSYSRDFGQQPTTQDSWEFSDGGFISGDPSIFVTRTPAFVSFGALQSGGNTSQVYCFRLRQLLLVPNYDLSVSSVTAYVNKTTKTPTFYDSTGAISGSSAYYFSFATPNRPGLDLSAVVEVVYNATTMVDMGTDGVTIRIADGFTIPLYGISAYCNVGSNDYLPIVESVGNRVVLSGYDNRVLFSNANWNYRGIGWNNFQVSTIDFQTNSAYAVSIGQSSSKVIGIKSVNGVIIVATDTGIFRISGENATLPPNATVANFSRLSNEVLPNADCLLLYENKIFFVSDGGLFKLEYARDNEEIIQTPISVQVSDYFTDKQPRILMYSSFYRAFMVGFSGIDEMLVYVFESDTFAVFKLAFTGIMRLFQTFDGYTIACSRSDGSLYNVLYCIWDTSVTDLSNANGTIGYGSPAINAFTVINSRSLTIANTPTDVNSMCTPAELVDLIDPGDNTFSLSYGDNHTRVINAASVVVSEYSGGIIPAPILSFALTKAYMSDKLLRSHRIRAVNLLVSGIGNIYSALVLLNRESTQTIDLTSVNSDGDVSIRSNVNSRKAVGDTVNIRLRHSGTSDAWAIAMKITDSLKLLGWQLDTSAKKRGRLY